MMNRFWSKSLVTLAASGLFVVMAQADLAEFNAINAAARAARQSGAPGHPSLQIALAPGLPLPEAERSAFITEDCIYVIASA